jgi:hypothetical protein
MEEFLANEDGRDLPQDHYRCPVCGWKFHRATSRGYEYTFQGQRRWMPSRTKIQRTAEPWEGHGPLGQVMER